MPGRKFQSNPVGLDELFGKDVTVRWVNSSVVVFHHFSLFKSEFGGVESNGIFVGDLYMQRNFVHLLGHAGILLLVRLVLALIDAFTIIQNGLDQLGANSSSPIGSQHGQGHNVQSVLNWSGAFILRVVTIALYWFNASANSPDDKAIVVGEFVQMLIVAFYHILIEAFIVSHWKGDCVDFAELQ